MDLSYLTLRGTFFDMKDSSEFSLDESNEFYRATVIANQTFKRLQKKGHSDEDAKRMVVAVINAEEAEMKTQNRPFDEVGLIQRLRQLP